MGSTVPTNSKVYSSFDPKSIPSCSIWIDAADTSSFTLISTTLSTLRNKVTNTNLSLTFDNSSVTWSATGLNNSMPAFNFANGHFNFPITNIITRYTNTIFIVAKIDTSPFDGAACVSFHQAINGSTVFYRPLDYAFGSWRTVAFFSSVTAVATAMYQSSSHFLWSTTYDGTSNNNTINIYYNGENTTNSGTVGVAPTTSPTYMFVGCDGGTGNSWPGKIAEIIVYNTRLTNYERQQVEGYLYKKWNLSANALATHPFKRIPLYTRPFHPLDVSDCQLWLDAADSTSFTLVGSSITQWKDKSMNGLIGTAINSPTVVSTTNGQMVRFNGTSQYINFGNVLNLGLNSLTIFAVTKFTGTCGIVGKTAFGPGAGRWLFNYDTTYASGPQIFIDDGTNPAATAAFTNYQLYTVYSMQNNRNTFSSIYTNGTLLNARFFSVTPQNLSNTFPLYVASYPNGTGTAPQAGYYLNGDIAEIIVYFKYLTTTEMQQVEGYLANKWRLMTTLSASHPFYKWPSLRTVFNPLQISPCNLWLDAADGTTLTGTPVTQWNDKSGNGRNAVRYTGNSGSINRIITNGISTLDFGTNVMTIASYPWKLYSTIFIVAKATLGRFILSQVNNVGASGVYRNYYFTYNWPLFLGKGGNADIFFTDTAGTSNIVVEANQYFCFAFSYNGGGSPSMYFVNGTSRSVTATSGVTDATTTESMYINGSSGGSGFDSSVVCEILHYNTQFSTYQRQQVEGYLCKKWGILSKLPSTHPFKELIA